FSIILDKGYQINQGLKLYLKSTVPTNAGLSSSSSLELLILTILNSLFNLKLTKTEMALIGQEIENKYIGVNSGIMDQYAIIHGKKDHAILLDTNKLEHRYIPLNLTGHKLIIINSNKKRSLTDSKYNQRFRESQQSLNLLKKHYNISALAQLKETDLLAIEKLNLGLLFKRIRHVVTEQERVLQSVEALESGEIEKFAKLMIASHNSLKNDYEVTGLELDALVNASLKAGALGARMTGAGFGGCIIVLVEEQKIESFTKEVANDYCKIVNLNPSFYYVETSDGTKEI
ncbi:MAG: galactokinase, partial [Acholeplasmataceae bacterium]|nr:galactokinase [Acholeplasmataceae bacterium]